MALFQAGEEPFEAKSYKIRSVFGNESIKNAEIEAFYAVPIVQGIGEPLIIFVIKYNNFQESGQCSNKQI